MATSGAEQSRRLQEQGTKWDKLKGEIQYLEVKGQLPGVDLPSDLVNSAGEVSPLETSDQHDGGRQARIQQIARKLLGDIYTGAKS